MGELKLSGITKIFSDESGEIVAVDDLNVEIEDGELIVFVGPSGSGKSTTLRTVAGLESPTEGTIELNGSDVTDRSPQNRDMAMVFQSFALYPHMTARENISFGLKMSTNMSETEIDERVERTAKMMGIENLLDQKPDELSGGQQQRVALGRAIVREPEVFLMDEPLANLDAKLRTTMRTELQELHEQLETTMLYVTHNQTEAMTMGDRIAVMNDAQLQQIGTPLDLYHEPANQFVAGFIGSPSMNFFEVTFDQSGPTLRHEVFEYELENRSNLKGAGSALTLGIRPEDIVVTQDVDAAQEPNTFLGEVRVTEPLGEVTYIHFELEGDDHQVTATVGGEFVPEVGSRIAVSFPPNRIHVFGPEGDALRNRESVDGDAEISERLV